MEYQQPVKLTLVRAGDDLPRFSQEFREELQEYTGVIKEIAGSNYHQSFFVQDGIGAAGGPLGEYTIEVAKLILPVVTALGGAWIQSRYGRKIRVETKDFKIEANTKKEVEELIEKLRETLGEKEGE